MLRLLLHDYDERDLAGTRALLELALGSTPAQIDDQVSRNAFLRLISGEDSAGERALALIDLRGHESRDQEFSGLRLIETIALNPDLRLRAIPMALTRHRYAELSEPLHQARCAAAIDKRALEDGSDVVAFLEDVLRGEAPGDPPWLPEQPNGAPADNAVFTEIFPELRMTINRLVILAGIARALRHDQIAANTDIRPKTVENNLEDLRAHVQSRFVNADGTVALALAADELFERAPQCAAVVHDRQRGLSADLRRIPAPPRVEALWRSVRVVRNAWLDPESRSVLKAALEAPGETWAERLTHTDADVHQDQASAERALTRGGAGAGRQ